MQIQQTRSATVSVSEGAILLCGLRHLATSVSVVCRQDETLLASPGPCSVVQKYSKREHNKIGYRSQAPLPGCAGLRVLVKSRAREEVCSCLL
jgi:hypothetical protein